MFRKTSPGKALAGNKSLLVLRHNWQNYVQSEYRNVPVTSWPADQCVLISPLVTSFSSPYSVDAGVYMDIHVSIKREIWYAYHQSYPLVGQKQGAIGSHNGVGYVIRHQCVHKSMDTRPNFGLCVNPQHWSLGSHYENSKDARVERDLYRERGYQWHNLHDLVGSTVPYSFAGAEYDGSVSVHWQCASGSHPFPLDETARQQQQQCVEAIRCSHVHPHLDLIFLDVDRMRSTQGLDARKILYIIMCEKLWHVSVSPQCTPRCVNQCSYHKYKIATQFGTQTHPGEAYVPMGDQDLPIPTPDWLQEHRMRWDMMSVAHRPECVVKAVNPWGLDDMRIPWRTTLYRGCRTRGRHDGRGPRIDAVPNPDTYIDLKELPTSSESLWKDEYLSIPSHYMLPEVRNLFYEFEDFKLLNENPQWDWEDVFDREKQMDILYEHIARRRDIYEKVLNRNWWISHMKFQKRHVSSK